MCKVRVKSNQSTCQDRDKADGQKRGGRLSRPKQRETCGSADCVSGEPWDRKSGFNHTSLRAEDES